MSIAQEAMGFISELGADTRGSDAFTILMSAVRSRFATPDVVKLVMKFHLFLIKFIIQNHIKSALPS